MARHENTVFPFSCPKSCPKSCFHAQNHAQRALVESDEFLTSKNNNQFLSPISCLEYVIVLTGVLVPLVSQVWVRFSPIIGKVGAIFKIAPTF